VRSSGRWRSGGREASSEEHEREVGRLGCHREEEKWVGTIGTNRCSNQMRGLLDRTTVLIHPQNADVGQVRGATGDSLTHQLKADQQRSHGCNAKLTRDDAGHATMLWVLWELVQNY
jgi:hypothetical protein